VDDFKKNPESIKQLCHLTLKHAADSIYWIDSEARIYCFNETACNLLDFSREELDSLTIFDITTDFSEAKWSEQFSAIKTGGNVQFETFFKKKTGAIIPVEINAVFIEFEGKEYICYFVRDISDRRIIEETLRYSESNLAEAQRLAHLGSWNWNIVTNDLSWSDEIYRIFGLTPQEFGATYEAFLASVHPDDREYVKKAVDDALQKKEKYDIEHRIVLPGGEIRTVNERAKVSFDDKGKAIRMIGTVQDITERKKAEDALRNALKEVDKLKTRLQRENIYLQEEIKTDHNFDSIITGNSELKKVLRKIEQVASTSATVLILGETGTGKELFARAIHNISDRRDRPLVKVNCAALPANLIESELFGHEKGAFTGALARKIGRFEVADKGTIFLDEIGDLPLDLQAKFLKVLQDGEFERVGDPETIKVDVRVIAATNRNLEEAIKKETFREDLYYRLNVFPINILPLRERKDDIPLLVNHFVKKYAARIGKKIESVSQKLMNALQSYNWPGNVRELENIIERAVILAAGDFLQIEDLPHDLIKSGKQPKSDTGKLREMEKVHILKILKECNWIIDGNRGAARRLGLPPSSLRDRIKKLGLRKPGEP
jgi:PAS domain S-box-containing protein